MYLERLFVTARNKSKESTIHKESKVKNFSSLEKLFLELTNNIYGTIFVANSKDAYAHLVQVAEKNKIDITVVGPELPLTLGISDEFKKRGLKVFGPGKEGAKLEGSKAFAKQFMRKYEIPTAKYNAITSIDEGMQLLGQCSYPIVVKANGLAAGKGVIICVDKNEAEAALRDMLETHIFGDAGNLVIIEEYLVGREVSLLCFTDGETIVPMETASDYKRALDNDMGANTGGMGSISPSPYYTPGMGDDIAKKTLEGIKKEGFDYCGVIYIGLILTTEGPKVLEYNARFGDPETEAILPRLDSDLTEIIKAVVSKRLSECEIQWNEKKAVNVIIASEGYPGAYETGYPIDLPKTDSIVFHAGTAREKSASGVEEVVSDGGRVLAVTALGESFDEAREKVYHDVAKLKFQGSRYRSDIGVVLEQ